MTTLWKALAKPTTTNTTQEKNLTIWKAISRSTSDYSSHKQQPQQQQKLRKCTSLKVASSLTRVCLCAPISSYTEVFQADVPPRRSNSYPRSKPLPTHHERTPSGRISMEGRKIFRGKSLTDDVLMRRFVIEEEAMTQLKRRNEMEIIRKRNAIRRRKLGPSPLSKMVLADQEEME